MLSILVLAAAGCEDTFPKGLNDDLGFSSLVFVQRPAPPNSGAIKAPDSAGAGGNVLLLDPAVLGGDIHELTGLEEGDVNGIDVSPDGKTLVASIKTDPHDSFHLFSIDIEQARQGGCFGQDGDVGQACTRLTFGPADDTRPVYLPDGRIGFLRLDPFGQVDFQGRGRSRVFYAIEKNGGNPMRLDTGPGHVFGVGSSRDGKVHLVRWTRRSGASVLQPLSLDPSGFDGLEIGGSLLDDVPMGPVQDDEGRVFASCVAEYGTWAAGTICQRNQGGEWPVVLGSIPAGNGCSPSGRVRDAYPLKDGRFIASYANVPQGCLNASDGDRGLVPDFSIVIVDPATGNRMPIYNRGTDADIYPRPVVERTLLDDDVNLGVLSSSCEPGGVVIEGYMQDANGQLLTSVARLRVLEGLSGAIAPWVMEIGGRDVGAVCGSADNYVAAVQADGSFRVRVPAAVPLRIQALDHYGAAVKTDPLWRGGPKCSVRACSGCHAGAEKADDFGESLAAGLEPADLSDRSAQRSIDFARDIQPILDRSCATSGCHDAQTAAGNYVDLSGSLRGLDLSDGPGGRTSNAYQSLMLVDRLRNTQTGRVIEQRRPYVIPGSARESRLVERLGVPCRFDCTGQPDWAPWALGAAETHPEDQPDWSGTLTDEERWMIVEWIDAGAPFFGRGATP